MKVMKVEEVEGEVRGGSAEEPAVELKGEGAGCVLYRSGAEGPVGVVVKRDGIWGGGFRGWREWRGVEERDVEGIGKEREEEGVRVGQEWGWSQEGGSLGVFRTLAWGGCAVHIGGGMSPRKVASVLREEGVRVWWTTGSVLERVAGEFAWGLKQVKEVVCEEEAGVMGQMWERLTEEVRERVYGVYGYSEGGGSCLKYGVRGGVGGMRRGMVEEELAEEAQLYVLDGEGEPVGEGVVGEIYVGGGQMALGYEGGGTGTEAGRYRR